MLRFVEREFLVALTLTGGWPILYAKLISLPPITPPLERPHNADNPAGGARTDGECRILVLFTRARPFAFRIKRRGASRDLQLVLLLVPGVAILPSAGFGTRK